MSSYVSFVPFNRHILVQRAPPQEKENSGILLPEGYKKKESQYEVVRVLDASPDCAFREQIPMNTRIVVMSKFLEDIDCAGKTFTVVLENYVMGLVSG